MDSSDVARSTQNAVLSVSHTDQYTLVQGTLVNLDLDPIVKKISVKF